MQTMASGDQKMNSPFKKKKKKKWHMEAELHLARRLELARDYKENLPSFAICLYDSY